jgi:hypothetical protein
MTSSVLSIPHAPDPTFRHSGAAALAAGLAVAASSWIDLVQYRPASRWTALLPRDVAADALDPALHPELATAQIWLLSWLPGQGTPLHDHGRSAGAFAVVRGTLTERVVAQGRAGQAAVESSTALTGGRVRHFGPHYVHQVTNTADGPAVSVHVYAPALVQMNTYSLLDGLLLHTGVERAGADW